MLTILKNIKLYQKTAIASFVTLVFAFLMSVTSAEAFFTSCGNLICPDEGGDTITGEITDFSVDFDPTDNQTTVDILVEDVAADVALYYSTTEEVNSVIDVVQNDDNGSIDLYIGVCSTIECTPHNPKRMVVKVQQEGDNTVLVKRVIIDDNGDETIFSSYEDTTTDLSDEELAWLREVLTATDDDTDNNTDQNTNDNSGDTTNSDDSGSSENNDTSSSDTTNTTPAAPPVCSAETPSGVTGLSIISQGANSVTLSWSAANPATHYALIFTRNSDGAQYGAANIGNTTSYTIQGISGQASYTFEVFAVHDCQPGDRASVTSPTFAGPVLSARPVGDGGQVLGATTTKALESEVSESDEKPKPSPSPSPVATAVPAAPAVLGATDSVFEVCRHAAGWLPILLLVGLAVVMLIIEYVYRKDRTKKRWYLAGLASIITILAFYILNKCSCATNVPPDVMCYWFWLLALIVGIATRMLGMQFISVKTTKKKKS
jgi:hypothetical protein